MTEFGHQNSMCTQNRCSDVEIDLNQTLDGVNTTNIRDKRLRIEMTVLREMVVKDEIKVEWTKNDYHLAVLLKYLQTRELTGNCLKKPLKTAKHLGLTIRRCK